MDDYNKLLLDDFRRQWQDEITATQNQNDLQSERQRSDSNQGPRWGSSSKTVEETSKEIASHSGQGSQPKNREILSLPQEKNTTEVNAKSMYMLAVKHEQSGDVVQAVKWYKKALQLDPDIEQQIYAETRKGYKIQMAVNLNAEIAKNLSTMRISNEENTEEPPTEYAKSDLFNKFLSCIRQDGRTCSPLEDTKGTHISALPHEVLIYILKWVVSSDLDLRSLEQVSMVCRGLYVCSRDIELWKQACYRIWGDNINQMLLGYTSFRDMYIQRPHVWFHGCYISKASYVRRGENSFQDIDYQPWHLVNYYRYIRFFADGVAVMLTTADDPAAVVGQMQRKKRHLNQGHYTISGSLVSLIFKRKAKPPESTNQYRRKKRNEINNNTGQMVEQIFRMELEINPAKKKLHNSLRWVSYTIETVYIGKDPTLADFDVHPTKFPPFWFSRVRSYNTESEHPL